MNTGILTSSLQVTTSFGVLHASVTSRISCHCECASDSLCCRLCILWTAMLLKSLHYSCATRSLRSYGGWCSEKEKNKKKNKKPKLCCIHFWKCFHHQKPVHLSTALCCCGVFFFNYFVLCWVVFFFFFWGNKRLEKKILITSREPQRHPGVWRPLVRPAVTVQPDSGESLPNVYLLQKHTSSKKQRDTGSVYEQLKGSQ